MKIYINNNLTAIDKIVQEELFYQGAHLTNRIRILTTINATEWTPSLHFLLPNGRTVGPIFDSGLSADEEFTVIEEGILYYKYDFILTNSVLNVPGSLQMTLAINYADNSGNIKQRRVIGNFINTVVKTSMDSGSNVLVVGANKDEIVQNMIENLEVLNSKMNTLTPLSHKGAAKGVATLDSNKKVPLEQMPDTVVYTDKEQEIKARKLFRNGIVLDNNIYPNYNDDCMVGQPSYHFKLGYINEAYAYKLMPIGVNEQGCTSTPKGSIGSFNYKWLDAYIDKINSTNVTATNVNSTNVTANSIREGGSKLEDKYSQKTEVYNKNEIDTKLSELKNDLIIGKNEEVIENPTTLIGSWKFTGEKPNFENASSKILINYKAGTQKLDSIEFRIEEDTIISGVYHYSIYGYSYTYEYNIYSPTALSKGLAYKSGELKEEYYLTFEEENEIVLEILKTCAEKVIVYSLATEEYVDEKMANLAILQIQLRTELPTENISPQTLYLIRKDRPEDVNIYEEFMYIDNKWERIGDAKLDLSGYLPLSAGISNKLTGDLWLDNGKKITSVNSTGQNRDLIALDENDCVVIGSFENIYNDEKIRISKTIIPAYQDPNYGVSIGDADNSFLRVHAKTIYQDGKQVATKEDLEKLDLSAEDGNLQIAYNDSGEAAIQIGDEKISSKRNIMSTLEISSQAINTPVVEVAADHVTPAYQKEVSLGLAPGFGRTWKEIHAKTIYQDGKQVATKEDLEKISLNGGDGVFLLQEYNSAQTNAKVSIEPGIIENDALSVYATTPYLKLETTGTYGAKSSVIIGRDTQVTTLDDTPLVRIKAGDECYHTLDGSTQEIAQNDTKIKLSTDSIELLSGVIKLIAAGGSLTMTDEGVSIKKLNSVIAPVEKGSTVFSAGVAGQVLTTDGVNVYWGNPEASSVNLDDYYTKKDVDTLLGEVTSSGGGIVGEEFVTINSQESSFELLPNKYYNFGVRTTELKLTLNSIQDNVVYEFMGEIRIDEPEICRVTFNNDIRWRIDENIVQEGNTLILNPKYTYSFSVLNKLGVIMSFANKTLETPVLTLDRTFLSWTFVDGADRYDIYMGSGMLDISTLVCSTTNLYVDLSNYLVEPARYFLEVRAISNVYTDSVSTFLTYLISETLTTPTNLVINDAGTLSWDAVTNASSYIVLKDGVSLSSGVTNNYLDLSTLITTAGTYSITVQAIGDGTVYLASEISSAIEYTVA